MSSATTHTHTQTTGGGAAARPQQGEVVCACQRLTKVFKDFWLRDRARALDSVSFEIRSGEIFGLLGPNGSGKSTAIKIMLGLLRPTRGRVVVFGKPPTNVKVKKRVGFLPEESYLYGFLNARETLDYYGKLFELDSKTRRRRTDELLEMVGLTHVQHRPVNEYSKGMQRRIGIAQALINDPDFLILDEPTTGLDPIGTRQIKDLILELGRRGKTVLLSSHLLADVEDVVDRMVILYGGKIRGEGTSDELLSAVGKTTIQTDVLDEETIAEIDKLIRARSGGERAISSVSHPRRKLEELFLSIVEQARRERSETAGAEHGGATASFLTGGDDGDRAQSLIRSLVEGDEQPEPMEIEEQDAQAQEVERSEADSQELIEGLVGGGADSDDAGTSDDPRDERYEHPGQEQDGQGGTDTSDTPAASDRTPPRSAQPPAGSPAADDIDRDVIGSLLDGSGDRDDPTTDERS